MEIKLDNGKYIWAFDEKVGRLTCLRHGELWRDETGDGAVLALLIRACELEDIVKRDLRSRPTLCSHSIEPNYHSPIGLETHRL